MPSEGLVHETFCQVGLVVEDIEASSKAWAAALGVAVPPWTLTGPAEQAHTRYCGRPTEGRAKLAFFRLGQVSIELIEPVDGPSTWRDGLESGCGVHHLAFRTSGAESAAAHLKAQGLEVVQTGDYRGGYYTYIDSRDQLGVMIELLQDRPAAPPPQEK